jgi:tRNA(Arg) A34 adenosine deaminase TadA
MPDTANPEFLRRAISLATRNVLEGKGGPFGAVIVRDGKIVGEGANSVTTTNDPTAHAEVNAIRAAARALRTFDLAGCEIYTSCEPCPMCLAAAYWARINAIYYGANAADAAKAGFDDAFLYNEMRKDRAARAIPSMQMLNEEACVSFKAWLESPNKIQY